MNGIRIKALTILFLFLFTEKSLADVIPLPGDLPTIEALISLHKLIKHVYGRWNSYEAETGYG